MLKHPRAIKRSAQRRFIDKAIFIVAVVQPLATLPQVITIFQTHNATSVALLTWGIYLVFDFFWLWFGIAERQIAIILSATIFLILEAAILVGGSIYGASW